MLIALQCHERAIVPERVAVSHMAEAWPMRAQEREGAADPRAGQRQGARQRRREDRPSRAPSRGSMFAAARSLARPRRQRSACSSLSCEVSSTTPETSSGSARNKPSDRTVVNCNANPRRCTPRDAARSTPGPRRRGRTRAPAPPAAAAHQTARTRPPPRRSETQPAPRDTVRPISQQRPVGPYRDFSFRCSSRAGSPVAEGTQ